MNRIVIRRNMIIGRIVTTLRKLDGREYDKENFLWQICTDHGCTMRKAKEYLETGKRMLKVKEDVQNT